MEKLIFLYVIEMTQKDILIGIQLVHAALGIHQLSSLVIKEIIYFQNCKFWSLKLF